MNTRRRASVRSRTRGGKAEHYRELLEGMAAILVNTGESPRRLAREFAEICSKLDEPKHPSDAAQFAYLWDLPHVIAHWHSDPQYIDSRGSPIPLPLRARGPSLSDLIGRVLPGEEPAAVARFLMRVQGVKRKGALYVPSGRYFLYSNASARIHAFTALLGMMRTVAHNVSPRRRGPPLLERTAVNPSFPAHKVAIFNRELTREADRYLWHVDEKMRIAEKTHRTGPRVRLGVGIFTFQEPAEPRRPRRRGRAAA